MNDHRIVIFDSLTAMRTTPVRHLPKPANAAGVAGLRYERRVAKQLAKHASLGALASVEYNPWFTYADALGSGICCPDMLLHLTDGTIVVVEVKLTWVPDAEHKLAELYMPVVAKALRAPATSSLVIIRNSASAAPPAQRSLREALAAKPRLLQWFDNGPMLW